MKLEILVQFIVPLAFLAIWALTSLLNRDAQPLPPRPGRPPGPGPGGVGTTSRGPGQSEPRNITAAPTPARPSSTSTFAETPARWSPSAPASRDRAGRGPTLDVDDAIVFIESGVGNRGTPPSSSAPAAGGSTAAGPRSSRTAQQRRAARGRSSAPGSLAPVNKSEPEIQRALSDMVNKSMARQKNQQLEITPLASPIAPLARPLSQVSGTSEAVRQRSSDYLPPVTGGDLRAMLANAGKLREIVLLNELLQPPLALRHHHARR
jgi:hypothetical protein